MRKNADRNGAIECAKLDGTERQTFVDSEILEPQGLVFDARSNRYSLQYYRRISLNAVYCCLKCVSISFHRFARSPLSLLGRLYWTDKEERKINWIDVTTRERKCIVWSTGSGLYDVTIFQEYTTWTDGRHGLKFLLGDDQKLEIPELENEYEMNHSYDVITYDSYLQPPATGISILLYSEPHETVYLHDVCCNSN